MWDSSTPVPTSFWKIYNILFSELAHYHSNSNKVIDFGHSLCSFEFSFPQQFLFTVNDIADDVIKSLQFLSFLGDFRQALRWYL